jgi:CBS domain-containing protein
MLGAPFFEADLRPLQRAGKARRKQKDATPAAPDTVAPEAPADDTPVATIMSTQIISFTAETTVETATRLMLERGISGAPVVDESGRPIGMVSKTDLLESWYEQGKAAAEDEAEGGELTVQRGGYACSLGSGFHVEAAQGVAVGDIMVPYLLAVSSRAPISLAAALMAYEGVHRLLVLNESNEMVGIVSSLDVLRWVAQLSGFCLPHRTQRQKK